MFLVAGIICFILLIVLHEYGHFLSAKRNGVEVEEFGVFFPPKLFGKKMGKGIFESYYTINLIPLGGFVKLKGENSQDTRKGSFGASSFWTKTKITLAGVITNYVIGILIFSVMAIWGMPKVFDNQWAVAGETIEGQTAVYIDQVQEGKSANQAGLEDKDIIISIDNIEVFKTEEFKTAINERPNQQVEVVYKDFSDGDVEKSTLVSISEGPDSEDPTRQVGLIGTSIGHGLVEFSEIEAPLWAAPVNGFLLGNQVFVETFRAIGGAITSLFAGDTEAASQNVAGPIGIIDLFANNVFDVKTLALIIGNISIALAVANLLPIPGLDGGRFYMIAIFKLLGKELTEKREQMISAIGVSILLILVILVTASDIGKIW